MTSSITTSVVYSFTLSCLFVLSGYGQHPPSLADRPSSCEEIVHSLDIVAIEFNKLSDDRKLIIVLAGSPSSKSRASDLGRINQAKRYLSDARGIRNEQVIYGIGRLSGSTLSYLAFYVGGKLVSEIKTTRNGRLCKPLNEPL